MQSSPEVDRIEIRESGWEAVDIILTRQGEGRVTFSQQRRGQRNRSFAVTEEQFDQLLDRLEPYRRQAVPHNEQTAMQFINFICPRGVPFVTDAGGIWIRWVGSTSDVHYLAELGCDFERHAPRNDELRGIVETLTGKR